MQQQYLDEILEQLEASFPGFDHSTLQIIAALTNSYHIIQSVMERTLSIYKITPQSMDVLILLYVKRGRGCLLGDIADLLMVSPANITGLVEGLVKKGLASRQEHPDDRRKRLAEITPRGIGLVEDTVPLCARFFQEVFATVMPADKQQLYEGLSQLTRLLLPYREKRLLPALRGPEPEQPAVR